MIVIEGLAMPKGEDDGILIALYDGKVHQIGTKETFAASEVPAHGRLIDADALIDDLKRQCKEVFRIDAVSPEDFWINRNEAYRQRLYESWCEGFYEYVGSRPTIIPAEEGE